MSVARCCLLAAFALVAVLARAAAPEPPRFAVSEARLAPAPKRVEGLRVEPDPPAGTCIATGDALFSDGFEN